MIQGREVISFPVVEYIFVVLAIEDSALVILLNHFLYKVFIKWAIINIIFLWQLLKILIVYLI